MNHYNFQEVTLQEAYDILNHGLTERRNQLEAERDKIEEHITLDKRNLKELDEKIDALDYWLENGCTELAGLIKECEDASN